MVLSFDYLYFGSIIYVINYKMEFLEHVESYLFFEVRLTEIANLLLTNVNLNKVLVVHIVIKVCFVGLNCGKVSNA